MKNFLVVILVMLSSSGFGQLSVTAGASMLVPFKQDVNPYGGFHIGLEMPRDDQTSLYGRFTHHFSQKSQDVFDLYAAPIDVTSNLPYAIVGVNPSMNYSMIEGGMRYYLGNGFDYGWAGYGGTNLMLILNKVKGNYSNYDDAIYKLDDVSRVDGSIFGLGAGLGGGIKYSDAKLGTFYFDLNLNYVIFAIPSSTSVSGSLYSPLIFNFNLGYRRDILWNK